MCTRHASVLSREMHQEGGGDAGFPRLELPALWMLKDIRTLLFASDFRLSIEVITSANQPFMYQSKSSAEAMPGKSSSAAVALVTGAGSGIGRGAAVRFAQAGCRTVVADINQAAADETCKIIQGAVPGAECLSIHCDITKPDQVTHMIQQTKDTFGRLDYAFNNAGIAGKAAAIHELPLEEWDRVMSINLRGHFIAMKHEIPLMLETSDKPSIVITSSVGGHHSLPGLSPYTASKFAVRGLAHAAALEYGPRGLRVNTVSPGLIETPMLVNYLSGPTGLTVRTLLAEGAQLSADQGPARTESSTDKPSTDAQAGAPVDTQDAEASAPAGAGDDAGVESLPLRHFGKPADIAEAVVWLCMHGDYITGTDLVIDGGMLAKLAV